MCLKQSPHYKLCGIYMGLGWYLHTSDVCLAPDTNAISGSEIGAAKQSYKRRNAELWIRLLPHWSKLSQPFMCNCVLPSFHFLFRKHEQCFLILYHSWTLKYLRTLGLRTNDELSLRGLTLVVFVFRNLSSEFSVPWQIWLRSCFTGWYLQILW